MICAAPATRSWAARRSSLAAGLCGHERSLSSFARRANGLTWGSFAVYTKNMKPGPFTQLFSLVARVDHKSMIVFDRLLKEAGILPTGGRGFNAKEVDGNYLAKVLIARMGTDKPARAVEAYTRFAQFQLSEFSEPLLLGDRLSDPNHTLFDLVSMLCSPGFQPPNGVELTVRFVGQALVEVSSEHGKVNYIPREEFKERADHLAERMKNGDGVDVLAAFMGNSWHHRLSLHGIVEIREFNTGWLEILKKFTFGNEAIAEFLTGIAPR